MAILPDFNYELGVARDYTLMGEDYDRIPQRLKNEYRDLMEKTNKIVLQKIQQEKLGRNNMKRIE